MSGVDVEVAVDTDGTQGRGGPAGAQGTHDERARDAGGAAELAELAGLAGLARAVRLYLMREAAAGRGGLWMSGQRAGNPSRESVAPVEAIASQASEARSRTSAAPVEAQVGRTPAPGVEAQASLTQAASVEAPGCPPSGPPSAIDLFETPDLRDPGPSGRARPGDTLERVAREIEVCPKCSLSQSRTRAVPGNGTGRAGIVFVGEGPGAEEDRRGEPFVGAAGKLLDRILQAMDEKQLVPGVRLDRESVYVTNVVKCRPPANRVPLPQEVEACSPYLRRQLALLRPKVICCLGKTAAEYLLGAKGSLAGMRGTVHRYGESKLIVTYHPAALLRNPAYKRPLWEDMQLLASAYTSD